MLQNFFWKKNTFSFVFRAIFFAVFFVVICPLNAPLFAQGNIPSDLDFYGIVSPDADSNMTGMTEDLFYAQLSDMDGIHVTDRRSSNFVNYFLENGTPLFDGTGTPFYAIIKRGTKNGTWNCTLYLNKNEHGNIVSYSRDFDSYYKIMTDAKQTIASLFDQLDSQYNTSLEMREPQNNLQNISTNKISTDNISGTWDGEDFIDRVVILRGGRGFIIFKNGASMAISVDISESTNSVTVTQVGPSNASYFPNLPRQTALTLAPKASPLSWTLALAGNETLAGTKNTYEMQGSDAAQATEKVTWRKRN